MSLTIVTIVTLVTLVTIVTIITIATIVTIVDVIVTIVTISGIYRLVSPVLNFFKTVHALVFADISLSSNLSVYLSGKTLPQKVLKADLFWIFLLRKC